MTLLTAGNISKVFDGRTLFENLSFSINDNEKIALIGVNGCGKSTFLKILTGEVEPTVIERNYPSIALAKGSTVGYLSQSVISNSENTLYQEMLTIFEHQISLVEEFEQVTNLLATKGLDEKLTRRYDQILLEIEETNAFEYAYLIDTVLSQFGFNKEEYGRKITSFSGGERSKIGFARLLLQNPSLLILDEPTNHLDISTIEWLTKYLKNYQGAILFVSHDRYFIDDVSSKIVELENGVLTTYVSDFEGYVLTKQKNSEILLKQFKQQKKEIEKIEWFINFYRVKPRFVSRVKDREKKLARISRISIPPSERNKLKVHFEVNSNIPGKLICEFKDIEIGYDQTLVDPFSFSLFSQDKIAIMGDNGVGKSTFIKNIIGQIPLKNGEIVFKRKLSIGYLAQNDFDKSEIKTLFSTISEIDSKMKNGEIRSHLARFGFYGDDVFKTLSLLSGGEQMRFNLAKIVLENHDLLLLDEPTNNLDLLTKDALIDSIEAFKGAVILVSHDRYVVDKIVNKIIYIKNGETTLVEGSYQDLKDALIEDEKVVVEKKAVNKKPEERKKAENKKPQLEKRVKQIEKLLHENKVKQEQESIYLDYVVFNKLVQETNTLEEELLQLLEQIDQISN